MRAITSIARLLVLAGIVEHLWSKFDALVDQRRSGTSPVMIEAILYLKENSDLWSIQMFAMLLLLKSLRKMRRVLGWKPGWQH